MPNPRQRRKSRAPAHKKVRPAKHAQRKLKKMKPIRGPAALQEAWDNTKTVRQNYAALGLVGSLKPADSGGSEIPLPMLLKKASPQADPLTSSATNESSSSQKFGRIIRDADGNVIDIQIPGEEDTQESEEMEDDVTESDEHHGEPTPLVQTLETLAASSKPVPRTSSDGEIVELKKLLSKHGFDFGAMAKDRRLNPWQRTAGQLKRASKKAGLV